jgi:hypothetical protein
VTAAQRQQLARRPLVRKVLDLTKGTVVELRQRDLPLDEAASPLEPEAALVDELDLQDDDE